MDDKGTDWADVEGYRSVRLGRRWWAPIVGVFVAALAIGAIGALVVPWAVSSFKSEPGAAALPGPSASPTLDGGDADVPDADDAVPNAAAGTPDDPITRRYHVLIYNPVLESEGGATLIEYRDWNDPDELIAGYVADISEGSHGVVDYVEGGRAVIDGYPVADDGYLYTDAEYLDCPDDGSGSCHKPSPDETGFGYRADYSAMLRDNGICELFNAGEIDELWVFGGPNMGFWMANQTGSDALNTAGPLVEDSECVGRLNIMGFNYERGVNEMVEDFAVRTERTLLMTLGTTNPAVASFLQGLADRPDDVQCGSAQVSPNTTERWNNTDASVVRSGCDDWVNYPNLTGATTEISCEAWGCEPDRYKVWWMRHVPHVTGTAEDGSALNWWTYVLSREA